MAWIAAQQHGVVDLFQLWEAGLSRRQVQERVRLGRLFRVHRGVYAVGLPVHTPEARWMAAVLACGHWALLSHRSAGALWEIWPAAAGAEHVTDLRGHSGPREGLHLHLVRDIDGRDRAVHRGIPVTSPARTLLDLAPILSARSLDAAVNEARVRRLVDPASLRAVIARHPRRHGTRALARTLTGPLTRSGLERSFRRLLEDSGLAAPEHNVHVAGWEVDAVWPSLRLVVELDGAASHTTPARIARDVEKDAALRRAGWNVVRFTWWDLTRDEGRTFELLRRAGVAAV